MVHYDIRHARPAEEDLIDILKYIGIDVSEPSAALRMLETIDKSIESLSVMPHRYPLVDDERLAALGYRKLPVKNYLVFFTIGEDANTVYVERILYARRDWLQIL